MGLIEQSVTDFTKDMSKDPKIANKDEFISHFQNFSIMHPEWDLNDIRVLRALRSTIIDGWSRGQEKVLEEIIPLMVKEINVKNIDLNSKDLTTRIDAEKLKADKAYDFWLQSNIAKQKTDLDTNSVGMIAYEKGAGGFGALAGFVVAIIESFKEGSLEPLKAYVADTRSAKSAEVHARAASAIENKYGIQNLTMNGATTAAEAVKAGASMDPLKGMTGGSSESEKAPQENAGVKFGGGTAALKENAGDLTKGKATPDSKPQAPAHQKPIVFGYPAPEPS